MYSKLSRSEAIARYRKEHPRVVSHRAIHFANINKSKDVWWYDIPCSKLHSGVYEDIHLLAYDRRSDELHFLRVPVEYFTKNLSKFVVRVEKRVISLELSASHSDCLCDLRPAGGRMQFRQFLQLPQGGQSLVLSQPSNA